VDLTTPLTCILYAGAGQCDVNKGTDVGSLIIGEDYVTWDFDGYRGEDFHLYAGKCFANDKGNHLSTGTCDADDMQKFARVPGQYSLKAPSEGKYSPALSTFVFDENNHESADFRKGNWVKENYLVFPLQGSGRRYLSAHSTVCPSTAVPLEGSASRSGDDESSVNPAAVAVPVGLVVGAALVAAGLFVARRRMIAARNDLPSISSVSVNSSV
jgi:hypothetical protein